MATYNRDAAAAYAIQFSDELAGFGKYNKDGFGYIDPKEGGEGSGDCTNFASQCLWAGGHPMMGAWTNTTPYAQPGTGTTTWNSTNSLRKFLIDKEWATAIDNKSELKKGDLVYSVNKSNGQYKHVVVVCRDVEDDGKIYICGHTANQRDKVRVTPAGCRDYYLHLSDSFPTDGTAVYHAGYESQEAFDSAINISLRAAAQKTIIALPADKLSPERVLYRFLFMEEGVDFTPLLHPDVGLTMRNIRQTYQRVDQTIMSDRDKAKAWFKQIYKEQPTFVTELMDYYAEKHSKECKEFVKSFKAAFNYLAAPRRIPKVR